MKKVVLKTGQTALVDDADFGLVNKTKWYLAMGYAVSSKGVLMHRLIMHTPKGYETDHINENRLDNRKSNLRVCTSSENKYNRGLIKSNRSGYKGVYWHKEDEKFMARIRFNKKYIYLGQFTDAREAAYIYNRAAIKYHGPFAKLNDLNRETKQYEPVLPNQQTIGS